ncbi:MAG: M3 family oligoendopeptidase [Planctomycetota bacterium]|nr:MAG: M3 family oligoendopeptidase [Planctomycetota bacterium]
MKANSYKFYPRQFVPVDAEMGEWDQIAPLFSSLDTRSIDTVKQLEQWLLDLSELNACIYEELSKRYVAMTRHTDDQDKEKAYLFFIEHILPQCKVKWQKLRERYVASAARKKLPPVRYMVYDRSTVNAVGIFREKNIPLQTEDDKLDQKYKKLCGAMTVEYDGKEQTLQQMDLYLKEPDRAVREQTWKLVTDCRLADREVFDEIFDKMIELRTQIAHNAGFDNYRDYAFKARERFDYTPADCFAFHEAIESVVVPAYRAIQEQRRKTLGVDKLRPWDLVVDPYNQPPLKPFKNADELCRKCSIIFHKLDPELGKQFDLMMEADWLDLESRKGKAPGGYQSTFDETRHPFIFMNAVGIQRDVETLLHEAGHAFHAFACRDEPLVQNRNYGAEIAEVASMGMELLAFEYLDAFYTGQDLRRARREQLESVIWIFPWMATIDSFQHWLYTHPDHTRRERTEYWLSLMDRFGGIEDWSGLETAREARWQRQLHLFGYPFYYIEYGIAQIGALQLWYNYRADKAKALKQYRQALALGGSRSLPELWEAAGLKFDFSQATLRPLIEAVLAELKTLE